MSNTVLTPTAVGQEAIRCLLAPDLPEPYARSFIVQAARRSVETSGYSEEFYPPQYATDGSLIENLRFTFKHEPLDLRLILMALQARGHSSLGLWIRREPTGVYSRRAWFLFEKFTGEILDHPDVT